MFEDRAALAGLNAFSAVASAVLPEREAHAAAFEGADVLLDAMTRHVFEDWAPLFVRWEIGLLDELGFGLDLTRCAATGSPDDLIYVSPRTGRAVSRAGGEAYRDRLLRAAAVPARPPGGRPQPARCAGGARADRAFSLRSGCSRRITRRSRTRAIVSPSLPPAATESA